MCLCVCVKRGSGGVCYGYWSSSCCCWWRWWRCQHCWKQKGHHIACREFFMKKCVCVLDVVAASTTKHCCTSHWDEFMVIFFFFILFFFLFFFPISSVFCFKWSTSVMFQWRHLNYVCSLELYPVLEMHDTWTRFTDTAITTNTAAPFSLSICGYRYTRKNPIDKIYINILSFVDCCCRFIWIGLFLLCDECASVSVIYPFNRLTSLIVLDIRHFCSRCQSIFLLAILRLLLLGCSCQKFEKSQIADSLHTISCEQTGCVQTLSLSLPLYISLSLCMCVWERDCGLSH